MINWQRRSTIAQVWWGDDEVAVSSEVSIRSGADLGGGRGADAPPPQGFDTLPTQRVPPLILFQKSIFGRPTLWGGASAKKTQFFCQNFSKSAQKRLFWLFFQKFACGAENFSKKGAKQWSGRARKVNLVNLKKKKVVKILEIFLKIRPPPSRKS